MERNRRKLRLGTAWAEEMTRYFSDKSRPVHLGPYPLERLARTDELPDFASIAPGAPVLFRRPQDPLSIVNALCDYQAMLDAIRGGFTNKVRSDIPADPLERSNNVKAFCYFNDAAMVGICELNDACCLQQPLENPDIAKLAEDLRTRQTKTLAAGIDTIMADLKESMDAPAADIGRHTHAVVLLYEYPRDPTADEPGVDWLIDAQAARACLLASENAVTIANYLRVLGFDARAHSGSCSDVNLQALALAAGLLTNESGELSNPYLGKRFGLSVVTTEMMLATDKPLQPLRLQNKTKSHGIAWKLGLGFARNAGNHVPFTDRRYIDGPHPFETLTRVDQPTTFIDEQRVPRVPKRADMFARAQFGDMGKSVQAGALNGRYVNKSATASAERRALGAFVLLQNQEPQPVKAIGTDDAQRNTDNIKATCYFLGVDAVGISRCPDWTWYSHDAAGNAIDPPHDQAISIIIDQGYETMEGASGDDWISVSQSMRAYLRFSLLGGVIAAQIRNLGYPAKPHTVLDGEVLQPPLLLLAGLGEVSRIGEVILNPFLGPRLKSGVVTTTMPLVHDKPIDFGLQKFCESCNKCARECPSGAITAGPKLMFNGYEIWKSDSQKCATYRINTPGGAMCGRCMKTCPWNLEGLFVEKPFRWAAMNVPAMAPLLTRLDDAVGNGGLNPVKKWWWDITLQDDGSYAPVTEPPNRRGLQKELKLKYEDQTLAVYPAPLAPHPWPYPFAMDREKGIEAYQAMITAEQYQLKLRTNGLQEHLHEYRIDGESPVIAVKITVAEQMAESINKYEFQSISGEPLPSWTAGAHIDIVVAPGYMRQYSLSGDPADDQVYQIAVLKEDEGPGGSKLMHRIFSVGRRIFIARPLNHFELEESAPQTLLLGGGIGITPLIAMAHRLHAIGAAFELHYSCRTRSVAGFLDDLKRVPWQSNIQLHFSDEGGRLSIADLLAQQPADTHVYTCGPDRFIDAVVEHAEQQQWPDENIHREYFSVPEVPAYQNNPFVFKLARSGKTVPVAEDQSPTDALLAAGVTVDVKCSDGLCGVCKCRVLSGQVEHRDFVLSSAQREHQMILCQSRAAEAEGVVEIDL